MGARYDPKAVSAIIALNDLESREAARLLARAGVDTRTPEVPWGGVVTLDTIDIESLRPTVLLVECPSPALEARLQAAGRRVEVVDHHIYAGSDKPVADRRNGLSILEQFVDIFDLELNQDEMAELTRLSANDRGFIPALARVLEGQGEKKIETAITDLRRRELAAVLGDHREAERRLQEARAFVDEAAQDGRLRTFQVPRPGSDSDLILVQAPAAHRLVLMDAIYAWQRAQGAAPAAVHNVLAIFHDDDPQRSVQIEFSGHHRWFGIVRELVGRKGGRNGPYQRLELFAGGAEAIYFGAKDRTGRDGGLLDALADELLDNLLVGNRPLLAWRTHFMQVLAFAPKAGGLRVPDTAQPEPAGAAERAYFLRHVRDFLTPEDLPRAGERIADENDDEDAARTVLSSYQLCCGNLAVRVTSGGDGADMVLPLRRLRLHLFFHRTAVLEWEFGWQPDTERQALASGEPALWRRLLEDPHADERSTLAEVLDINARARMCASTFDDGDSDTRYDIALLKNGEPLGPPLRHGGEVSGEDFPKWFGALAEIAVSGFGIDLARCELLSGPRARVVTSVVAAGGQPTLPAGRAAMEVMLARLQTVDEYDVEHFSDATFANRELAAGHYTRFAGRGSHFLASNHSFAFLGYGWYPLVHIHKKHMPLLYLRMFLLTVFYTAILQRFARQLGGEAADPGNFARADDTRRLRRKYLQFANRLWFDTVTSEIQGVELFDLMRQQSWIGRENEQIKEEVEISDAYQTSVRNELLGASALLVGALGLIIGVVSFVEPLSNVYGWASVAAGVLGVALATLIVFIGLAAFLVARPESGLSRSLKACLSRWMGRLLR